MPENSIEGEEGVDPNPYPFRESYPFREFLKEGFKEYRRNP
jgi:hypothetical protein